MSVGQVFLLCVCLICGGCQSLASLAESLNARQVQSCLYYSGFAGGALTGAQVQIRGITATGGVKFEVCTGKEAP